jgi:hypothetical protein
MTHALLRVETPAPHLLIDLAPRVRGHGDYVGEYGYALALTSRGDVRVTWDDGDVDDVDPSELTFFNSYANTES